MFVVVCDERKGLVYGLIGPPITYNCCSSRHTKCGICVHIRRLNYFCSVWVLNSSCLPYQTFSRSYSPSFQVSALMGGDCMKNVFTEGSREMIKLLWILVTKIIFLLSQSSVLYL